MKHPIDRGDIHFRSAAGTRANSGRLRKSQGAASQGFERICIDQRCAARVGAAGYVSVFLVRSSGNNPDVGGPIAYRGRYVTRAQCVHHLIDMATDSSLFGRGPGARNPIFR